MFVGTRYDTIQFEKGRKQTKKMFIANVSLFVSLTVERNTWEEKKIVYWKKGKHSSSIQIVVITQQYTTSDIRQILFVFKDLLPLLQETPVANTKSVLCHGQKLTTLPLIKDISNIFEMNTLHYIYIFVRNIDGWLFILLWYEILRNPGK